MARKQSSGQSQRPTTLRERAEAMLPTTRTEISAVPAEEVQRSVHELQIHQMELELQNQKLREAQLELAESRDRYADLFEFAPVGYVTLNEEGQILEANLTAATMLGVERGGLLRKTISTFVSRVSQDTCNRHHQAVFTSETKHSCEIEMRKADGKVLVVRLESFAFGPEHGRATCRLARPASLVSAANLLDAARMAQHFPSTWR
jgi:PAS domain S-box-containing protein